MDRDRIRSCRGHRRAHVVLIGNAHIDYLAASGVRQHNRSAFSRCTAAQHDSACAGHRPLGGWRTLVAQLKRRAVLALCCAEMAACRTDNPICIAAVREHAAQRERFRHCRASSIKPIEGNLQIAGSKSCRDDLVEQIASEKHLYIFQTASHPLHTAFHRRFQQTALCGFK